MSVLSESNLTCPICPFWSFSYNYPTLSWSVPFVLIPKNYVQIVRIVLAVRIVPFARLPRECDQHHIKLACFFNHVLSAPICPICLWSPSHYPIFVLFCPICPIFWGRADFAFLPCSCIVDPCPQSGGCRWLGHSQRVGSIPAHALALGFYSRTI